MESHKSKDGANPISGDNVVEKSKTDMENIPDFSVTNKDSKPDLNKSGDTSSTNNTSPKPNSLPIEKECFGFIQDIIIESVNNIIDKLEEKEKTESFDLKSDSDDSRYQDGYITIDNCDSDYDIADEDDIKLAYENDLFKRDEDVQNESDDDVLIIKADEEKEEESEEASKSNIFLNDSDESKSGNVEIIAKRKSTTEPEIPAKKRKIDDDDDKLFEDPTNIKVTIANDETANGDSPYSIEDSPYSIEDSPYSITENADDDLETYSVESSKPFENIEISVKNNKKIAHREEVEYVSQDPQENADNYNEEWQQLKLKIGNEEERYKAIRDRWKNLAIPNPNINLTFRQRNNPGMNSTDKKEEKKSGRGHQRSHSCTSFYEEIISKLNCKLDAERQKVLDQHHVEVSRTQQILNNELKAAACAAQNTRNVLAQQNLKLTHYRHQQTLQELQNCYQTSIEQLETEHMEQVELYEQYMEEVRAFNTFYQGLTVNENLELSDEQYEHLAETERMYMVYKDFYENN